MKILRNSLIIVLVTILAYTITSCGSGESSLPGTWVTESVTAEVDSTLANLATLDLTIATTKSTTFIMNEDHTMALTIDGYVTNAFWTYDSETDIITFTIGKSGIGEPIELGKLDGKKIVYTSSFKHGSVTAVYEKE